MNLEPLICQVCNKETAIGVAASPWGPCSFAYCKSCLQLGADPYGIVVGTVAMCGGVSGVHSYMLPLIDGTLQVAGKSMEQFEEDVKKEIEEYNNYFNNQEKENND